MSNIIKINPVLSKEQVLKHYQEKFKILLDDIEADIFRHQMALSIIECTKSFCDNGHMDGGRVYLWLSKDCTIREVERILNKHLKAVNCLNNSPEKIVFKKSKEHSWVNGDFWFRENDSVHPIVVSVTLYVSEEGERCYAVPVKEVTEKKTIYKIVCADA